MQANAGAGLEFLDPRCGGRQRRGHRLLAQGRVQRHRQGRVRPHLALRLHRRRRRVHRQRRQEGHRTADPIPNFLQNDDDYDLPDQASDTVYGGISVTGSASAGGGGAYATAGGGVEAGVGARYSANGDVTYFFKAKANVNAAAGNSFAGGFGANGDGEVMIGVTYDADGNEKAMTATGIGTVSGGLDLRATPRTSAA